MCVCCVGGVCIFFFWREVGVHRQAAPTPITADAMMCDLGLGGRKCKMGFPLAPIHSYHGGLMVRSVGAADQFEGWIGVYVFFFRILW